MCKIQQHRGWVHNSFNIYHLNLVVNNICTTDSCTCSILPEYQQQHRLKKNGTAALAQYQQNIKQQHKLKKNIYIYIPDLMIALVLIIIQPIYTSAFTLSQYLIIIRKLHLLNVTIVLSSNTTNNKKIYNSGSVIALELLIDQPIHI